MGGRNQGGQGVGRSTKTGRPIKTYDRTEWFKKRGITTLKAFEDDIRNFKEEYAGTFDAQGNLMSATTSYSSHSTGVPIDTVSAYTLTHNHPSSPSDEPNRKIGATFSGADVTLLAVYGRRNEGERGLKQVRAVSNGPHEYNYIMRYKPEGTAGKAIDLAVREHKWETSGKIWEYARAREAKVFEKMRANGYSEGQIKALGKSVMYGVLKNYWKRFSDRYGLDYVEFKKEYNY